MAKPAGKDKTYVPPRKQRAGTGRPTSPLLQGREQDVALIDQLLNRIDRGGSTLVISGEPGIGKSALLEIAKHRANERDIFVLSMTGVLAEVHLPFAALEQALRPLMKRAVGLVPRQRSALLAAFGMHDDTGAPDIFLVALATLSLLTESATRKPILLVADDAQWLDQATYDVLAFISRRLGSDPVVLMAGHASTVSTVRSATPPPSGTDFQHSTMPMPGACWTPTHQASRPNCAAASSKRLAVTLWPLWNCRVVSGQLTLEIRRGFR